jgi:hypothetical protein
VAAIIWFVVLFVSCAVSVGAANWASARSELARNVTTFLLAAAAAYSASFVVDIWAQAATGSIPGGSNVIFPSITWLFFAVVGAGSAVVAGGSVYAAALPYAIVATLALTVSRMHEQNLAVGLVLTGLAIVAAFVQWQTVRSASRGVPGK